MDQQDTPHPNPQLRAILRHSTSLRIAIIFALPLLSLVSFAVWQSQQKQRPLLLTEDITSQIQGFDLYFYESRIPSGYYADQPRATYDQGVLLVPLIKGDDTITLSEQAMPSKLSRKALQQNGEVVDNPAGDATINHVEGRLIGTFISSDGKTLALLTTNDDSDLSKHALKLLLKGLQHI